ncbi:MAG: potassium-transporting ATPase subunit C [Thermoplasmatales archaeon]|nr:potassium-transporting ATPase subunit C [Thermoplasmatales archaeon]MCW6169843.1 potassium-transporting ATPase subunit C [Thermoplasmatales archaeon]
MVKIKAFIKPIVLALVVLFVMGFAYPTVMSIITEKALPNQSTGSPIKIGGKIYGSYLLAEAFNSSIFFQPRPSAISYNLSQTGGGSCSLDSSAMLNLTEKYIKEFEHENPGINSSQIPEEMVSFSGSGLDPDIPLQGAIDQVNRISVSIHNLLENKSLNIGVKNITSLLMNKINEDKKQNFPFFGSYYVNTVFLNFAIIDYLMNLKALPSNYLD